MLIIFVCAHPRHAVAATITVTTTNDTITTGDGVSLREAITSINAGANVNADVVPTGAVYGTNDTILFAGGGIGRITLGSTLPTITKDVSITGAADRTAVILDGNLAVQILRIDKGTVNLANLRITNGYAPEGAGILHFSGTLTVTNCLLTSNTSLSDGGAIADHGTLMVTNSTFLANVAASFGGAILSSAGATLTVTGSTFSGNNHADVYGGGIFNDGTATVTGSSFDGNSSGSHGGGIYNSSDGRLTVANTTFSSNVATNDGGGIYSVPLLVVTNSTFSGNSAHQSSGGIRCLTIAIVTNSTFVGNRAVTNGGGITCDFSSTVTNDTFVGNSANSGGGGIYGAGRVTITNSIVAGNNAPTGPDIYNSVSTSISSSHNLLSTLNGVVGITNGVNGDIVTTPPLLGVLGDYGGPTQTISLLPGSPATSHGEPIVCATTGANKPNGLDQRGFARPVASCAIGAFEPHTLTAVNPSSGSLSGSTIILTGLGFIPSATVNIGRAACANVTVLNSTSITCTAPAHAAGAVDVTVVSGGATATLTGGYTYGVVTSLPSPQPPGGAGGSSSPLLNARPNGGTGGTPNPLPPSRP